jgi:nitrogen regulatory protein P-II 1
MRIRVYVHRGGAVKLVTAIIRTNKLDEVMNAVSGAGAHGLTASEARGFGQQYGHTGQESVLLPKLRIDVVVQDELVTPVTEAIIKSAQTGAIGDGKIWVVPVESALRVRTGERDWAAV